MVLLPALGLLLLLSSPIDAAPSHQFDAFFPGWNAMIQSYLRTNCSAPFYRYQKSMPSSPKGSATDAVFPLIECILDQFPEFRKAEMAASAVILGLLPTILQSLGSTSAETSLLGLRRPVLALLCATGSPAVRRMTAGEFLRNISRFTVRGGGADQARVFVMPGLSYTHIPAMYRLWVSVFEYGIVGGAVANVMILTYQLSVHALVVFSPRTIILLPLWTSLAVVIHLAGVLALYMRVRMEEIRDTGGVSGRFRSRISDEFTPSFFQPSKTWELRTENIWFQVTTWMLSIGTVAHTVFGTLILSSLLFFSVADSVNIVARYAISTVACRTVLRFELAGMSEATKKQSHEETQEMALKDATCTVQEQSD
ncbi:hypothetical protein VP1G_07292 [Cytospora mali]|uniref:Uncharacterized protein n=1 Tax=Cytospora mali TaxID=578113 RepID=A0A194V7Z1_CYTMA|nr:hypothetical protein VP1G_07292 [Valsa mali var. pyri (nom. inval.)]